MKHLMALSLGTMAALLSHRTPFTRPLPFLDLHEQ